MKGKVFAAVEFLMPLGVLFMLALGICSGVVVRRVITRHQNAFVAGLFASGAIGLACSQADVGFWQAVFRHVEHTTILVFAIPTYTIICMSFCALVRYGVKDSA